MIGFLVFCALLLLTLLLAFGPWFAGYRTIWVSRLTMLWGFLLPVLAEFGGWLGPVAGDVAGVLKTADWRAIIGPEWAPVMLLVIGVIFEILRRRTTTPVGGAK